MSPSAASTIGWIRRTVAKIAKAIADKLSELRPDEAPYFRGCFETFSKRLSDADKVWDAEMRPYRGRTVVTYHRSWLNFLKHFQPISVGEIEPRPGIPPSRSHTKELIDLMKHEKAKLILVEPYFELKTPNAIAERAGRELWYCLLQSTGRKVLPITSSSSITT